MHEFDQVQLEEDVLQVMSDQVALLKQYSTDLNIIGEKYIITKKKQHTNIINEDSVSQMSLTCASFVNHQLIKMVAMKELPTAQKNCHIFSACLLDKGRSVGLCLGGQEPFLIYDLSTNDVRTIKIEKQGVFDALELPGMGILLGCNRTVKVIDKGRISMEHFPLSPTTPSRIIVRDRHIFATDCLTQLGIGGSYCV
jgi:hypothetical protein